MNNENSTYSEAVQQNLAQMGTPASEWAAVPVESSQADSEGRVINQFSLPAGYDVAPTLYRCTGQDMNCELCAHPIKNVFWLQNDTRKWLMIVGSECVTHFAEGKSGEELAADKRKEQKREVLRRARVTWQQMVQVFREKRANGERVSDKFFDTMRGLGRTVGKFHADGEKAASDRSVSSWLAANGERVAYLLSNAKEVL